MAKVVSMDCYKKNNKEKLELIEFFYNRTEYLTLELEKIKINNQGFENAAIKKVKELEQELKEMKLKYNNAVKDYKTEYVGSGDSDDLKKKLMDKLNNCLSEHFTDEIKQIEKNKGSERFNSLF